MTEREKFEKWFKDYLSGDGFEDEIDKAIEKDQLGDYKLTSTFIAFDAYQAATKAAVPEGWKLVPVEPTEEMVDAGKVGYEYAKIADCDPLDCIHDAILEAIAAAPEGQQ